MEVELGERVVVLQFHSNSIFAVDHPVISLQIQFDGFGNLRAIQAPAEALPDFSTLCAL